MPRIVHLSWRQSKCSQTAIHHLLGMLLWDILVQFILNLDILFNKNLKLTTHPKTERFDLNYLNQCWQKAKACLSYSFWFLQETQPVQHSQGDWRLVHTSVFLCYPAPNLCPHGQCMHNSEHTVHELAFPLRYLYWNHMLELQAGSVIPLCACARLDQRSVKISVSIYAVWMCKCYTCGEVWSSLENDCRSITFLLPVKSEKGWAWHQHNDGRQPLGVVISPCGQPATSCSV